MRRVLHFFSLSVLTQITLMLGQLVLLPLQVRLWGQATTAAWYSAYAVATISYLVDCGLRTAGHAELILAVENPFKACEQALQFRRIWGWIRLIVFAATLALIAGDGFIHFLQHSPWPLWRGFLIVACALEAVLVIRITYLDSLAHYRGAEASYLLFAVLRLGLSVPALLALHSRPTILAAIHLATAGFAVWAQGRFLCRTIPLLQLASSFPELTWQTLALARHTVAEPLANWTRLSLPVLILGQLGPAPAMAVTTYVGLRAIFGAGRTTIQQLARVASVEFLKYINRGDSRRARSLMALFLTAGIFFGAALGCFVIVDNVRVLGLWLKNSERPLFQQLALTLAITAPFFTYQIPMNLLFRRGQLSWVARRHYAFVAYSFLFAGLVLAVRSLSLYLVLLAASEIALSTSFFTARQDGVETRSALRLAAVAALAIFLLGMIVRYLPDAALTQFALVPMAKSGMLLLLLIAFTGVALTRAYWPEFVSMKAPSAVAE